MIKLDKVNKYFNKGKKNQIHVVNNVSLDLPEKGLVSLLGPSGCGKTTILNVIGGLDKVNKGKIYIDDDKITRKLISKVDKVRNIKIGYIFQDFKLLDDMSVYDNVALVLKMIGIKNKEEIKKRVDFVLDSLNIYRYRYRPCAMLSGGERQRVAIARALVKDPDIILADEPTGNLDSKNTIEIMNIIKYISKTRLVLLVTHETNLAHFYADRIIELSDGEIIKDYENKDISNLDYRLENNIYLKDLEKVAFKDDGKSINVYSENKEKISLELVVRGNNIFIKTSDNKKIEVVDDNSNIVFINDHYKAIDAKEANKYEYRFDEIIDKKYKKKYSRILNLFTMFKSGFDIISKYSTLKKVLLLGYIAASMFIVFSVSKIFTVKRIDEKDFVTSNKTYLSVTKGSFDLDDYKTIKSFDGIEYALLGDGKVYFNVYYNTFLQAYGYSMDSVSPTVASYNLISDKDVYYGRMPENNNECVIDKMSLINIFEGYGNATSAGLLEYEDIIGTDLVTENYRFKIVGLTDLSSPSIYINPIILNDLILHENTNLIFDNYQFRNIELVKGKLPLNDYETILPDDYIDIFNIGNTIDEKINGKKLKVVGFYKSNDTSNYLVNENMVASLYLKDNKIMTISSKDKESTILLLENNKYKVVDVYDKDYKEYKETMSASIRSSLIFSGVIIIISLIEIYLMIRSSFLSRIKEVGTLRAIGVKRSDICRMFLGEILVLTLVTSIVGISLMSYILYNIIHMEVFKNVFVLNYRVVAISFLITFIFNIIVGLIPVFNCIRKRPAVIFARTDI